MRQLVSITVAPRQEDVESLFGTDTWTVPPLLICEPETVSISMKLAVSLPSLAETFETVHVASPAWSVHCGPVQPVKR